tara:strand:+ start:48 stop:440 length:393 start_codon:yes stop_codon:yes gene_type:complete
MKEQKNIGMPMKEDWDTLQYDPNKIAHRQRELGHTWAEKQAIYDHLIDLKNPTKDEKCLEYLDGGKGVGESGIRANASNEYKGVFLAGLDVARKDAMRSKIDYDAFVTWVGLLRSKGANLRTEMQLSGQL